MALDQTLTGKRVLVVGASAGIGRVIAEECLAQGADVVVAARRGSALLELADGSSSAHVVVGDVRSEDDCDKISEAAVSALGEIDLFVYSTGSAPLSLLVDTDTQSWTDLLLTNVVGAAALTRRLVDHMSTGGISSYLSSETVGRPRHGLAHYAASKAALEEMVDGWRTEHPEQRFATVRVGATAQTDFASEFDAALMPTMMEHWVRRAEMPAQPMDARPLGRAILRILVTALDDPSIDLQDLTIRAPGRTLTMEEIAPFMAMQAPAT